MQHEYITARQHLQTISMLVAELLDCTDEQIDLAYEYVQEADDALTDALNEAKAP